MRISSKPRKTAGFKRTSNFSESHLPKEQGYWASRASRIQRRMMIGAIGRGGG